MFILKVPVFLLIWNIFYTQIRAAPIMSKYIDYKLINARVVDTSRAVLDPNVKISSEWVRVIFKKVGLVRVVCYLKHPITQKTAIGTYDITVLEIY